MNEWDLTGPKWENYLKVEMIDSEEEEKLLNVAREREKGGTFSVRDWWTESIFDWGVMLSMEGKSSSSSLLSIFSIDLSFTLFLGVSDSVCRKKTIVLVMDWTLSRHG